ncbi:MAG: bifunctional folylpolyglutamate synthase/dihydrofolate synthase [Treponemataceae bacterium]|nr:bifunctional folylpolyglutamate synthase/dihydrofolate synthase [Treponemataceae bacterium]
MDTKNLSLSEFENWLNSFLNFEKTPKKNIFWLDTMRHLCQKFGNPQNQINLIHAAGSKGKGTVCNYMASILSHGGNKTGLYTSPHLLTFFERIAKPDGLFENEIYLSVAKKMLENEGWFKSENLPSERPTTWFELVTLYAFLVFKEAGCDWAVLETGLGGRLDATNVCVPKVSVLMPIELEHTEFLGDTIEKVAFEKSGIIKDGIPVVCARQKTEAENVFRKVASENHSPIYFFDEFIERYEYDFPKITLYFKAEFSEYFPRPLSFNARIPGEIQAMNASVAAFAAKIACQTLTMDQIEEGLSASFLPARFEIAEYKDEKGLSHKVVFDGAHTENSLNLTCQTFNSMFPTSHSVLFACAADKNAQKMSDIIFNHGFNSVVLTKPGEKKHSDFSGLSKIFEDKKDELNLECQIVEEADTDKAFLNAIKISSEKNETLLICGSFYLIAEIKEKFFS